MTVLLGQLKLQLPVDFDYGIHLTEYVLFHKHCSVKSRVESWIQPMHTCLRKYIKNKRWCLATFPNIEEKVENIMLIRLFLKDFVVFGKCDQTLSQVFDIIILSIETKSKEKREKWNHTNLC